MLLTLLQARYHMKHHSIVHRPAPPSPQYRGGLVFQVILATRP